jgi:hypothetical protein
MAVVKAESPARKWLNANRAAFKTVDGYPSGDQRKHLFSQIRSGRFVGILTPQGCVLSGRAVMQTEAGWLLGCAGAANSQALATVSSVVYVSGAGL